MYRRHAHHQAQKGPAGLANRAILEEVGINADLSIHNIDWAPNAVPGQHGATPQATLNTILEPNRGDRNAIIEVLQEWAEISASRTK